MADCSLPSGMWDPSFNLSHKVEFNFVVEEQMISKTSEQKMVEHCLELALRTSVAAWNLAYASNRGNLNAEMERLSKQLTNIKLVHAQCERKYEEAKKMIEDDLLLFENLQKASLEMKQVKEQLALDLEVSKKTILDLTEERDALCQALTKEKESKEEMYDESFWSTRVDSKRR